MDTITRLEDLTLMQRLRQFEVKNEEHQISASPLATASCQLLRRLIEENAPAGRTRLQDQEQLGWWSWLKRFEHELRKEKALLDSERPGYVSVPEQRQHRLLSMDAELAVKRDRSNDALKLVLKFKFDEHGRTKTNSDGSFQLLMNASLPPELLSLVFEAIVKSQVPHLLVHQSTSLASVAKAICSQWPRHLGIDGRSLMLQTATRAMLEHSLIKISANYTYQHTIIVPPTLKGNDYLVKHLVLDIGFTHRDGTSNRALNSGVESMVCLARQFVSLQVCVVLMHITHNAYSEYVGRFNYTPSPMAAIDAIRSHRNVKISNGAYKVATLQDNIIGFIDALLEQGPGKRKFVRFSHDYHTSESSYIGPLVSVSSVPSGAPSTGEPTSIVNAKRIFDAAYQNWTPRN